MRRFAQLVLAGILATCGAWRAFAAAPAACRIEVVEKDSGWPVPLVELRTTHLQRFITDNAGIIAFDSPELMGRETWFDIVGHGYGVAKDAFGISGVRLRPEPGKTLRVEVTRTIIARRLGRLTGGGLFAESQKFGEETSWPKSPVLGCDSALNAVYRGKLFWVWGDTTLADYPLGVFDATCATTAPQPLTRFEPPLKIPFKYFAETNGRPRGVAKMPGSGPTWLAGLATLPDAAGQSRLVAAYVKVEPPLAGYEWGLCAWNDAKEKFERLRVLWRKSDASPIPPPTPEGHTTYWRDTNGRSWLLFGDPFPKLRCPATFEDWQNTNTWEALTPPKRLISAGDGSAVEVHAGGIAWNAWRGRWVAIFGQLHGSTSNLGEIWYAEADSPFGPWGKAVKILSHQNYTFYNPTIHADFAPTNSPILLFEGTYSKTFADHAQATPRYDYNQILYRLDLDDPRLSPAHSQ